MKQVILQNLPPKAAHLCLHIEKLLLTELNFDPEGKELVLAYSGGADSKALFYILLTLSSRMGFVLSVAHLDHAFRESSALELAEARELAAEYGLICYAKRVEVQALCEERKIGREEAGRLARQQFFGELITKAEEFQSNNEKVCELGGQVPLLCRERWVVTGHQLNDLAEDVLMRLMRGSGWPALGGMRAVDEKHSILRPLLLTSRAEIEEFLEAIGRSWINDPMNEDQAFLRNRVRSEILPLFLRENPSFLETVADLWKLAALDARMFEAELEHLLPDLFDEKEEGTAQDDISLSSALLEKQPKAMRLRIYKKAVEAIGPGQPLLRSLMALDAAWESGNAGAALQFPGGKLAKVLRGEIVFSRA